MYRCGIRSSRWFSFNFLASFSILDQHLQEVFLVEVGDVNVILFDEAEMQLVVTSGEDCHSSFNLVDTRPRVSVNDLLIPEEEEGRDRHDVELVSDVWSAVDVDHEEGHLRVPPRQSHELGVHLLAREAPCRVEVHHDQPGFELEETLLEVGVRIDARES